MPIDPNPQGMAMVLVHISRVLLFPSRTQPEKNGGEGVKQTAPVQATAILSTAILSTTMEIRARVIMCWVAKWVVAASGWVQICLDHHVSHMRIETHVTQQAPRKQSGSLALMTKILGGIANASETREMLRHL